jgi:hypothetical protein
MTGERRPENSAMVRLVVALERRQATPPTLAEWVIAF